MLDSAGIPVVGGVDALLIAVATTKPEQAYWSAALAIVGSLAGSLILFFIARKGGEVLLMRHVTSKTGARLHLWFQRWGLATVFVPALSPIPLPMKIPVFCAGALQVRLRLFCDGRGCRSHAPLLRLGVLGQTFWHANISIFENARLASGGRGVGAGGDADDWLARCFKSTKCGIGKPE